MNTLTQQEINQYQWQVADDVARPKNPYDKHGMLFQAHYDFEELAKSCALNTNAPDGIYSGEAFELTYRLKAKEQYVNQDGFSQYRAWIFISKGQFDYASDRFYDVQSYLRLKPSHLPAVLTTKPGEEWKDRYKCYINDGGKLTEVHETNIDFLTKKQWYQLEWHLITPPAEQEAETVERAANKEVFHLKPDTYLGEKFRSYFKYGAEWQLQQLQSTLTQKDQRIAELESENELHALRIQYLEERITDISDWLYDSIPVGDVKAWDCILLLKEIYNKISSLPTPPQH